ncbi:putative polyketide synthase [Ustulina deusta]|nr:putative polyketide synthase [Ustulina deusta]
MAPSDSYPDQGEPRLDGDRVSSSDIAIIGFSFEFPQANTVDSFWELMLSGSQAATNFPSTRLCNTKFHGDDKSRNVIHPKKACFLERDIGSFDSRFFSMTRDEAVATDPQQRLLLETTYRALENAGITLEQIWGTDTSVHTGCFTADYTLLSAKDPERGPKYAATGMADSMLSNRISTFFNLTGPSGIVAGCNILYTADYFMSLSKLGFLSPDGICHSFDERANGYGRGEGFGVLIIKSMEAAIRDSDTIRAVIRATRSNQNGRTNLAQPSKEMQSQLIDQTYRGAGLDKSLTRYFEAHGTGTSAGDPLEAMAIGSSFKKERSEPVIIGALKSNIGHLEGAAGIAGVIKAILVLERGLIPPIAGLQELNSGIDSEYLKLEFPRHARPWPTSGLRRASVNSFGFGGTNSHVVLDDAYHYLQKRGLTGYHCTNVTQSDSPSVVCVPSLTTPPRKGVSHGVSPSLNGVNSVRRELCNGYSCQDISRPSKSRLRLFLFSASEQKITDRVRSNYREYVEGIMPSVSTMEASFLDSMAYTLAQRRSHHAWRSFAVADSLPRLAEILSIPGAAVCARNNLNAGFIFTGQGAQWYGMGKELGHYLSFRNSILEADKFVESLGCDWKPSDILIGRPDVQAAEIDNPKYSQPLCTILQVALVELLGTFNIHPTIVVGHSSGEIAAAYACGGISKESAWKLAYYRGLVSSQLTRTALEDTVKGAMMAVGLSPESFQPYRNEVLQQKPDGILCVACENSPQNITVSGDVDLIMTLKARLEEDGVFARVLKVPVAYHSAHMNRISTSYGQYIGKITQGEPRKLHVNMVSTVTGDVITIAELCSSDYWVRNMVSTVFFSQAVARVYRDSMKEARKKLDLSHRNFASVHTLVEIGPHSTLRASIREVAKTASTSKTNIPYYSCLRKGTSAAQTLLETVGQLHCIGFQIDMVQVNGFPTFPDSPPPSMPTLPLYPFNDSQIFWDEPRISRNIRLMSVSYNEFLGTPVPDWNPIAPRWRNVLKVSSIPWLQDHKVNGDILYPGAGMLVMAIEAMKQISSGLDIRGFEIKETSILSPLSIPEDDSGVEIEFALKPGTNVSNKNNAWAAFALYLRHDENFFEVCRGSIMVVTKDRATLEFREQDDRQSQHIADMIRESDATYTHGMAPTELYKRALKNGYYYGPAFQRVEKAHRNNCGQLFAHVGIHVEQSAPDHSIPAVIHPGSLDSMFQLMLLAVAHDDDSNRPSTWIPTYVSRLYISQDGLVNTKPRSYVKVHVSTVTTSSRLCISSINAVDSHDNRTLLLRTDGFEMTSITDNIGAHVSWTDQPNVKRLCYDLVYKPVIDSMSHQQTLTYISDGLLGGPRYRERLAHLERYQGALIRRTAMSMRSSDVVTLPSIEKQFHWIQSRAGPLGKKYLLDESLKCPDDVDDDQFEAMRNNLKSLGRLGEIVTQFSSSYEPILRGKLVALKELSDNGILQDLFSLLSEDAAFLPSFRRYIETLAHQNPGMRVLQIGASTGAVSRLTVDTLKIYTVNGTIQLYSKYDIADNALELAESVVGVFGSPPKMKGRVLDLEDPVPQLDDADRYDLVIAPNVSATHSEINWTGTDQSPGINEGVILVEITSQTSDLIQSILGFLPQWWHSSEDWRKDRPFATVTQWDAELKKSGFTGADVVVHDGKTEQSLLMSMIISSALPHEKLVNGSLQVLKPREKFLVVSGVTEYVNSPVVTGVITALNEATKGEVLETSLDGTSRLGKLEEMFTVVIQDSTWPSLAGLNASQYATFHTICTQSQSVLWLSDKSGCTDKVNGIGPIEGLFRTLRMEKQESTFATAVVDSSQKDVLEANLRFITVNFLQGLSGHRFEPELVQVEDLLTIPRVGESAKLNSKVHDLMAESVQREQRFGEQNLQLRIRQPGLLDSLYFEGIDSEEEINNGLENLEPHEVEIEVKAVGINFKDCLVALGRVDEDTLGTECAGVVLRAGSKCLHEVGDRVLVNKLDAFRGRLRCHGALAAKIPHNLSFAEAGASVTNFVTAYHSLIRLANIQPGETILIHSGAGGTGQAAIQVAQLRGATIYTTVSSTSKSNLLQTLYGIPSEHIFNSRNLEFSQGIKRLTEYKGVDVVLNSLAGDALVASWECIAPYGRFIEIGKRDIFSHNTLPMYQFARNVSFSAVDIGAMTKERPELIGETLKHITDLFNQGKLRTPSPMKVFPVTDVESAFRYLQSGTNAGRVVVEIDSSTVIPVVIRAKPETKFASNQTFIISGGLGGQGRSIARWMVARGARHLVLLSRSGAQSEKSIAFVDELRRIGVDLYCPRCNVGDVGSLQAVLDHCRQFMPPIKGCIQAAMDLRDGVFHNMSSEAWTASLAPKVSGSWNLHQQLPRDLDFFIMLSSVSGIIGAQGQANYAAGNTYQDELAKYRIRRGEKAVSLDLGPLEDEGYVAENAGMAERLITMRSVMMMSQAEVFALLDYYCNPARDAADVLAPQIITGLDIPADVIARGNEPSDWMSEPIFLNLHQVPASGSDQNSATSGGSAEDLWTGIKNAKSHLEAGDIVANGIASKLAKVLSMPQETFDVSQPLHAYGVDSLIALEIRNWLLKSVKVDVAVFEILGGATSISLGLVVAEKIRST